MADQKPNPIADAIAGAVGSVTPILALVVSLIAQARSIWAAFKAGNPTAVVDTLTGKFYKSEAEALADGALAENLKSELPPDVELIQTFATNAHAGTVEAHEAAAWARSLLPPSPTN